MFKLRKSKYFCFMISVVKVAKSARLFLTKEEEKLYQENIDRMIVWFEDIYSVEHSKCVYSTVSEEETRNTFNDETFTEEEKAKQDILQVLANTPEKKENFILVPKVI